MPDGKRSDLAGAFIERVDEADIPVAAKAEDVGNLLLDQIVDDNLATVHACHDFVGSSFVASV